MMTAQAWSPRFGRNLGLGFVYADVEPGTPVEVASASGGTMFKGEISKLPFKEGRSAKGRTAV